MKKNEGFTLLELLVVVAVIGILAAVSMPYYNDYITRGKLAEGTSALADGRIKMEQFFQDNRTYTSATLAANGCPTTLQMAATTTYFSLSCSNLSATTYTISAVGGNATNTSLTGWTYTINQTNTKGTTAAPTAWQPTGGVPQTCWVVRKKSC
jgi:type IV pilus assembly protein PilE